MNANTARLGRLAAASLVSAVLTMTASAQPAPGEPMFPALAAGAGDVSEVVVEGARYSLILERVEGGWVASERGDYPVRSEPVEAIFAALAAMVAHEMVTDDPAEYGQLDVQGPGSGTEDIHVRLADDDGDAIVDAIIGTPAAIRDPTPRSGIHVRSLDDPAVWLAVGGFSLPMRLSAWFDPLVQIPGPAVTSIAIFRGETMLFQADKVDPETGTYGLVAIAEEIGPMDRAVLDIDALRGLAQSVVSVTAEDVTARDSISVPEDARIVRITTEAGLVLTLTVIEDAERPWVTIDADATAPEAEAAAEALTARTVNWAFQLPDFNTMTLGKAVTDLVIITTPPSFY